MSPTVHATATASASAYQYVYKTCVTPMYHICNIKVPKRKFIEGWSCLFRAHARTRAHTLAVSLEGVVGWCANLRQQPKGWTGEPVVEPIQPGFVLAEKAGYMWEKAKQTHSWGDHPTSGTRAELEAAVEYLGARGDERLASSSSGFLVLCWRAEKLSGIVTVFYFFFRNDSF